MVLRNGESCEKPALNDSLNVGNRLPREVNRRMRTGMSGGERAGRENLPASRYGRHRWCGGATVHSASSIMSGPAPRWRKEYPTRLTLPDGTLPVAGVRPRRAVETDPRN